MIVKTLILGAGISGVSLAHFLKEKGDTDYLVLEKDDSAGGYCRSYKEGNFVFDYSGHFLHFKDMKMKEYVWNLIKKNSKADFKEYARKAAILINDSDDKDYLIDYPFQANFHQLPQDLFIDCLVDLYNAQLFKYDKYNNFGQMVTYTFGKKISELFFRPYNQKLYRTMLENMSADAMKRFIPTVSFAEIIRNFRSQGVFGYNSTFLYSPGTGIQGLVDAFNPAELSIKYAETVLSIDLDKRIVETTKDTYFYDSLVNTLPLTVFMKLANVQGKLRHVAVDVYNFGFDKKENVSDICWLYVPNDKFCFYRVGFYDYMSGIPQTSLYVEVSRAQNEEPVGRDRVLEDLKAAKIISQDATVVAEKFLTMDPAYAVLESDTDSKVADLSSHLKSKHDTHLLGRYGKWTYQSIEDSITDAKSLSEEL